MTESLRALLTGAIDYAGLFPPARLSLEETVRNYARYSQCEDAWMLGRLIVPAGRLAELTPLLNELPSAVKISALGRGGATAEEFLSGFKQDLADIHVFRKNAGDRATVDVIELKLPADASALSRSTMYRCEEDSLDPFVEVRTLQVTSVLNTIYQAGSGGIKFRCGGVEANAFPTIDDLTMILSVASTAQKPIKFTAGLHHPVRLFHESVNTKMHGFLNVSVAAIAAYVLRARAATVSKILDIEDSTRFEISDEGVRCDDLFLATQQIRDGRKLVTSFGSCSFDEPREDLRRFGWL